MNNEIYPGKLIKSEVKYLMTHCKVNPSYVFLFWECEASVTISTFICL
jgi:hypothetical protein